MRNPATNRAIPAKTEMIVVMKPRPSRNWRVAVSICSSRVCTENPGPSSSRTSAATSPSVRPDTAISTVPHVPGSVK